ncbi:3-ketoacyl-CoA synthase 15-like [Papaver somniferum]|nr:3-ketoacyl-CoA synthase 15-like [Papaver somniferum]
MASTTKQQTQREIFSPEIVKQGVEGSGPYAGSLSFSVKVRQGIPDFLSSVNLKYVKLGYTYCITHGLYFLTVPVLIFISAVVLRNLTGKEYWSRDNIVTNTASTISLLAVILYAYVRLIPRSTYLVDYACYLPPIELKISKEEFIKLARRSGNFDDDGIQFQDRVLKHSGIGDESYLPRSVFEPGKTLTLNDGREEAAEVIFGVIENLIFNTGMRVKDIKILILNCGSLNTTPSLSAMVINHYKLGHDIVSFNLGGMGCAAGVIAVDLAKDLLNAHPGSYALVVSTEIVSSAWYNGKDTEMLLPNCFFRMGAAALLLTNHHFGNWRAKYQLKQLVRTHKGTDDKSFKCIHTKDDSEKKQGLVVNSKHLLEVGGEALKANITTLGPLVLPFSEQLRFIMTLLNKKTKLYIPNFKLAFEHVCVLATSKKVLHEVQKNLELTEEYMEASKKTLERFGNTSSSSIWYELAYLEAKSRIKRGDRICQIAFGSGFKCNSIVWKALKTNTTAAGNRRRKNPWIVEDE